MLDSYSPDPKLLETILEPLLEDFQYWFDRSQSLLESEDISFLHEAERANLCARVAQARQEVATAKMLLKATDGRAGVEMSVLMPWHGLLAECWRVSARWRQERAGNA